MHLVALHKRTNPILYQAVGVTATLQLAVVETIPEWDLLRELVCFKADQQLVKTRSHKYVISVIL